MHKDANGRAVTVEGRYQGGSSMTLVVFEDRIGALRCANLIMLANGCQCLPFVNVRASCCLCSFVRHPQACVCTDFSQYCVHGKR